MHCFVTKSTALNSDCFYKVQNSPVSRKYKSGQINKFNVITITDQKAFEFRILSVFVKVANTSYE